MYVGCTGQRTSPRNPFAGPEASAPAMQRPQLLSHCSWGPALNLARGVKAIMLSAFHSRPLDTEKDRHRERPYVMCPVQAHGRSCMVRMEDDGMASGLFGRRSCRCQATDPATAGFILGTGQEVFCSMSVPPWFQGTLILLG